MSAHTPGPWTVHIPDYPDEGSCIFPSKQTGCAPVADHIHQTADARLIAAAPELLQALKECVLAVKAAAVLAIETQHAQRLEVEFRSVCLRAGFLASADAVIAKAENR